MSKKTTTSNTGNVINIKTGLAEMLKGGVIMDVVTPDQAKIAEDAGAIAVMALERVPSDIRKAGGVARMSPPALVESIMKSVSIPVMAKCRIGHFAEAQILQAIGVDYIDESEVLTPADEDYHINKHDFKVPLMRTKGEPGTGNIVEAVRHLRQINQDIRRITMLDDQELMTESKNLGAPYELVRLVKELGRLPVPNFAAGGIATPADAALCMQLGAETVFVGSGIFKSEDPAGFAKAIVKATAHFDDPKMVLEASKEIKGEAMRGVAIDTIEDGMRMANRGW